MELYGKADMSTAKYLEPLLIIQAHYIPKLFFLAYYNVTKLGPLTNR